MKLKQYLKSKKIKITDFAADVGCTQGFISLICDDKRKPSAAMALKIQEATKGEVTVMELLYSDREAA